MANIFLILICIILGSLTWIAIGSIILGAIDTKLEITMWKLKTVWWLQLLFNFAWPIILLLYATKREG